MKVCIITHDAGPAEVIAAYALRQKNMDFVFHVSGPAEKVFSKRFPKAKLLPSGTYAETLKSNRPDLVITGSSWGVNDERAAWKLCAELKIKTICMYEGWGFGDFVNGLRYAGKSLMPDSIWVFNQASYQQIQNLGVPKDRLEIHQNFYLEDISNRIREKEASTTAKSNHLLYVCENISSCEAAYEVREGVIRGYDEFSALEFFFQEIKRKKLQNKFEIRIRPHPSETSEKYAEIVARHSDVPIHFSKFGDSLEQDIAWSHYVVGCESMALVVAVNAKREVYSLIPPSALIDCRLPFPEIKRQLSN